EGVHNVQYRVTDAAGNLDLDEALNDLLDQIEISGRRRRKMAMDMVERIFTLRCPYLDRTVPLSQCKDCPYCELIDEEEGCVRCMYGVGQELEFMTTCPKMRSPTRMVNCEDCRFGVVDRKTGTVVCRYFVD
ncbi:MAG: hypothetical protein ACLFPN_04960, partial [Methanomassiliicoccales archaeon]